MSTSQQIRIGVCLLLAQVILLAMTMAFHAGIDRSAERAGIATIITEAGR